MKYFDWMPPEAVHVSFVLFLSFLIGLEREERKSAEGHYSFGGVRTFPLIGLIGYAIGLLSGGGAVPQALVSQAQVSEALVPQAVGFAVIGVFLMISYWHKLTTSQYSGITSEMSGLATYLVGALVYDGQYWIATTLTVTSVILLELKAGLENLARRIEPSDILTFAKFMMLSAVTLPLLPDTPLTEFNINPFRTWLVVVAVSGISYGSYVLQRLMKGEGGILPAAILGGAYSSTVATVALARRSKEEEQPHLFSGGILIASGMMYLRLAVLLAIFNRGLVERLGVPFAVLGLLAMGAGWLWSRRGDASALETRAAVPRNPLEISAALFFAALFVVMLVATHYAATYLGNTGVYALAAVMGVTDVDPFIMGLTQSSPALTPLPVAAACILIAAASNNLIKGIYAYALASRRTGMLSLGLLSGLAALGLVPLFLL